MRDSDARAASIPQLELFTKNDCPLCDQLKDELRRRGIGYHERSIATRASWYQRYGKRVPALRLPDGTELDYPLAPAVLERLKREFG